MESRIGKHVAECKTSVEYFMALERLGDVIHGVRHKLIYHAPKPFLHMQLQVAASNLPRTLLCSWGGGACGHAVVSLASPTSFAVYC